MARGRNSDPLDIQHPYPGNENFTTYTIEKNWIQKVMKGTRCACVLLSIANNIGRDDRSLDRKRLDAQRAAELRAVNLWKQRWGAIRWEDVAFYVSHTSNKVLVEMRVESKENDE